MKFGDEMKYGYPACFYKEDDGRYSVIMPDFPVASYGSDLTEAVYMIQEAAAGRIMLDLADGTPLPEPTPVDQVVPEYAGGVVSFVDVDIDQFKVLFDEKPVKKRTGAQAALDYLPPKRRPRRYLNR